MCDACRACGKSISANRRWCRECAPPGYYDVVASCDVSTVRLFPTFPPPAGCRADSEFWPPIDFRAAD